MKLSHSKTYQDQNPGGKLGTASVTRVTDAGFEEPTASSRTETFTWRAKGRRPVHGGDADEKYTQLSSKVQKVPVPDDHGKALRKPMGGQTHSTSGEGSGCDGKITDADAL